MICNKKKTTIKNTIIKLTNKNPNEKGTNHSFVVGIDPNTQRKGLPSPSPHTQKQKQK